MFDLCEESIGCESEGDCNCEVKETVSSRCDLKFTIEDVEKLWNSRVIAIVIPGTLIFSDALLHLIT